MTGWQLPTLYHIYFRFVGGLNKMNDANNEDLLDDYDDKEYSGLLTEE